MWRRHDNKSNDTEHDSTQQNDGQYKITQQHDVQYNNTHQVTEQQCYSKLVF